MSASSFFHCSCFYTHNIYIKSLDRHFNFINTTQFLRDYKDLLCLYNIDAESLMKEVISEVERRKQIPKDIKNRKEIIKKIYVPLNKNIYCLQENMFENDFLDLLKASKALDQNKVFKIIEKISHCKQIYSFPVFKSSFCEKFLAELQNFKSSDLPKGRPNSMNNQGVLIDEIGFHDSFSAPLRKQYFDPIAKILYPEMRGQGLDSHKIFTVEYEPGKDEGLGYHFDNCEVTVNFCLGYNFSGGELYFGDLNSTPISESTCILAPHKVGHAIMHNGRQYHGALPIASGKRINLIMWMRSSSVRNTLCPMCFTKPSLVKSDDYGDGFTEPVEQVEVCDIM